MARSAYASVQSNQRLCYSNEESLTSYLPFEYTAKTDQTGRRLGLTLLTLMLLLRHVMAQLNGIIKRVVTFLRWEAGNVVWVLLSDQSRIWINTVFRYSYVRWIFPHFLDKRKY